MSAKATPRSPDRALGYLLGRTEIDPAGCWVWTGPVSSGYGRTKIWGEMWGAHRFSYHHLRGHLHRDHHVHHVCGVSLCVNPRHLELVGPEENAAEMRDRVNYRATIRALEAEVAALRHDLELLLHDMAPSVGRDIPHMG